MVYPPGKYYVMDQGLLITFNQDLSKEEVENFVQSEGIVAYPGFPPPILDPAEGAIGDFVYDASRFGSIEEAADYYLSKDEAWDAEPIILDTYPPSGEKWEIEEWVEDDGSTSWVYSGRVVIGFYEWQSGEDTIRFIERHGLLRDYHVPINSFSPAYYFGYPEGRFVNVRAAVEYFELLPEIKAVGPMRLAYYPG